MIQTITEEVKKLVKIGSSEITCKYLNGLVIERVLFTLSYNQDKLKDGLE